MQTRTLVFLLVIGLANAASLPADKIPLASKESHLQIQNLASVDITSTTVNVDRPGDYESGDGPQYDFQGVKIPVGQTVDRREELDWFADQNYFTMGLTFADGTAQVFSANLRAAINSDNNVDLHILAGNRVIDYGRVGDNTLRFTIHEK